MPQMEAYNEAMSSVRSSVEWLFGDIVNYFKFLDVDILPLCCEKIFNYEEE